MAFCNANVMTEWLRNAQLSNFCCFAGGGGSVELEERETRNTIAHINIWLWHLN